MSDQDKLEEILRKYANIVRGTFGQDKTYGDYDIPKAVKAIRKEFAAELQRIGEELIGEDEDWIEAVLGSNNPYERNRVDYENALRAQQRTRLSQIVKEYGGGDE